jgi:hypothetical protein
MFYRVLAIILSIFFRLKIICYPSHPYPLHIEANFTSSLILQQSSPSQMNYRWCFSQIGNIYAVELHHSQCTQAKQEAAIPCKIAVQKPYNSESNMGITASMIKQTRCRPHTLNHTNKRQKSRMISQKNLRTHVIKNICYNWQSCTWKKNKMPWYMHAYIGIHKCVWLCVNIFSQFKTSLQ